jgi:inward rectifier potassium channel
LKLGLRKWLTRPLKLGFAGYTIWLEGASRVDLRDSYHSIIALSWPRFLLTILVTVLAINCGFALLYLVEPGAVTNTRPGSFADAFFFSIETSATVGYGDMHPASLYGHLVSSAEICVGMAFNALMTGLLFVRFSRPKARIYYARNPVIALHGGQPTLMIRIANGRRGFLFGAAAHLSLLLTLRAQSGEIIRRVHELQLTRSRLPMFSLTWTLMHRIDETSPLHGYDDKDLRQHDARFVLGVEGHDMTVGAQVLGTKVYAHGDVLFGMRYTAAVSIGADGRATADLAAVSHVERDVGPEPVSSGWEDRTWSDA